MFKLIFTDSSGCRVLILNTKFFNLKDLNVMTVIRIITMMIYRSTLIL